MRLAERGAYDGCFGPLMDSIEAAKVTTGNDDLAAEPLPPPLPPQNGVQSLGLSITFLFLALITFAAGAGLRRHFHSTVCLSAVAAGVAAGLGVMLLLLAGWRQRSEPVTRLLLGLSAERWSSWA